MKAGLGLLTGALILATFTSLAAIRYVNLNSPTPAAPYTNWATAAATIQDAVDAANPGDTVLVTNGVYQNGARPNSDTTPNRVLTTFPLLLQSVNGPEVTVIDGGGTNRCVFLTNDAVLTGFTLTNGSAANGGGVYCTSLSAVVSNCALVRNVTSIGSGGALGGTLNDCRLISNAAGSWGGGGAGGGSVLNNCTLIGNTASYGGAASGVTLNKCVVTDNRAYYAGGGTWDYCTLNNCVLTGNSAYGPYSDGGGANSCTLNNCVLAGNSAYFGGGACYGTLNNCTVLENSSGNLDGTGAYDCSLNNCIVYFHGPFYGANQYNCQVSHCCIWPLPSTGSGNFTNSPRFMDKVNGNLRLIPSSPCINAGFNGFITNSTDLDGNPRIVGGTVDVGVYEFQAPTSALSYAWLQQYGLPIDGSADFTDPDGDGMNNWEEWITGTDPTNSASALHLLLPGINSSGLVLSWTSVTNRNYFLERSTNLATQPAFSVLRSDVPGQPVTTSLTDTNIPPGATLFYRVGVQQ